jgi:bifunctional non-homologous end joining protein LigD
MDAWFPSLRYLYQAVSRPAVLDGEIVVIDASGKPDFYAMRRSGATHTFVAFDALEIDGVDQRALALEDRRAALAAIVRDAPPLILRSRVFDDGAALFALAEELELEGIVAKRRDSIYRSGARTADWLKIKTAAGLAEGLRRVRAGIGRDR